MSEPFELRDVTFFYGDLPAHTEIRVPIEELKALVEEKRREQPTGPITIDLSDRPRVPTKKLRWFRRRT